MPNLESEFMSTMMVNESGLPSVIDMQEDGTSIIKSIDPTGETLGPGDYRDPYAIAASVGEDLSEKEVMGTMAGFVPGVVGGAVTGPQDIAALLYGGGKGLAAEEGEGIQKFLEGFSAISGVIGSEALFGLYEQAVDALPIGDEAKQGLKQGAVMGDILGAVSATPKAAKAGAGAVADYAAGAPARLEDAKSGVNLGMGVDPTQMVDEAIVGAQKALQKPTKENPVTAVPPTETEPGIIAFHGSGADFDQFSLEKIGTGEGAQAYGYGLYFTDSEDIAKFYRDAISMGNEVSYKGKPIKDLDDDYAPIEDNIAHMVGQQITKKDQIRVIDDEISRNMRNLAGIEQSIKDYKANPEVYKLKFQGMELDPDIADGIKDDFKDKLDASIRVKENIDLIEVKPAGKMYKVGLKPSPEDMLDYQTTFADQPKKVQDALKAVGYEVEKNRVGQTKPKSQIDLAMRRPMPMILESLKGKIIGDIEMGELEPGRADEILSKKLLEQGVPGIKYRAAGSRAGSIDAADAEMNYVIFDDKAIKILEKYGIVGPVAITALGAAKQEGADDGNT